MRDLKEIRKEIDRIDNQIIPLLEQRFHCSVDVAEYKRANNLPILNAERENRIIEGIKEREGDFSNEIAMLYSTLMEISRLVQYQRTDYDSEFVDKICSAETFPDCIGENSVIACGGTVGSYTGKAAEFFFGSKAKLDYYKTFEDVFDAVDKGLAEFGVVPVENSTAGSVKEIYDLILQYRFYINSCVDLSISHCLLSVKGAKLDNIKTVYSKDQALMQCSKYLEKHNIKPVENDNTALAAKLISELNDKSFGAIASKTAAEEFGLDVLAENIQNTSVNTTRFYVISKKLTSSVNSNKVSLCFGIPHTPGSLYKILARFAALGLNLTKIESRPLYNKKFHYCFYLDFSGNVNDESITEFLASLSLELPDFSFLGNYNEYNPMLD